MRSVGYEGKPLSPGQLDALRLAASGYTSRQIATRLHTTEQAVHLRLKEAAVRLGAKSRTHACVIAVVRELVPPGEVELPSLGSEPPQEALYARESAREPADGAPEVQDAARPPGGRTAARGEAVA